MPCHTAPCSSACDTPSKRLRPGPSVHAINSSAHGRLNPQVDDADTFSINSLGDEESMLQALRDSKIADCCMPLTHNYKLAAALRICQQAIK